jgi:uncharacterized membrane protein HdeD (DUF308 family)
VKDKSVLTDLVFRNPCKYCLKKPLCRDTPCQDLINHTDTMFITVSIMICLIFSVGVVSFICWATDFSFLLSFGIYITLTTIFSIIFLIREKTKMESWKDYVSFVVFVLICGCAVGFILDCEFIDFEGNLNVFVTRHNKKLLED